MARHLSTILVTGATGFIGRALRPALLQDGHSLRCATRSLAHAPKARDGEHWVECDLLRRESLRPALEGVDAAYYLIHSMGQGNRRYQEQDLRSAANFAEAAALAGLQRIVYLGGVAPSGTASRHLESRLRVGELLRMGSVPTLELRAAMVIGNGSASWQILRDLSFRLPAMILPAWTESRMRPVALPDAIVALVRALDVPLSDSAWFDIPGPDVLTAREMMNRIAAIQGRRVPAMPVPLLSPWLSSWWLRLVTRADFSLSRELVQGLTGDLLPRSERYWELIGHRPRWSFDAAARDAIARERAPRGPAELIGALTESLIARYGPRLRA